ncbi:unnamed protein product [Owenia fusiformis]|uniref:Uncharacterized protein n=1 Tax=Owenia fusiformis TaxID=6347 RepID=A0A8J1TWZ7_OWEFU|nr:unnamed protein product [Owenia fusiformis]
MTESVRSEIAKVNSQLNVPIPDATLQNYIDDVIQCKPSAKVHPRRHSTDTTSHTDEYMKRSSLLWSRTCSDALESHAHITITHEKRKRTASATDSKTNTNNGLETTSPILRRNRASSEIETTKTELLTQNRKAKSPSPSKKHEVASQVYAPRDFKPLPLEKQYPISSIYLDVPTNSRRAKNVEHVTRHKEHIGEKNEGAFGGSPKLKRRSSKFIRRSSKVFTRSKKAITSVLKSTK